ncbi:MAG: undecaprenyl-diphosphatase [Ottowia sp.]|nr:undecaprenyl-diphosphatase [Ottowia sp.]
MSALARINHAWFLLLNGGAETSAAQVTAATVVANGLIYLIPLLMVAYWLQGGHARRSTAIKACLVAGVGLALNQAIGLGWPQPRPFAIGLGHVWMDHTANFSFPSNHMVVLAGVGLTLLLDGHRLWGMLILLIAACVGWARIFLGVHFPFDILGAVAVAALSCALVAPLWRQAGGRLTGALERLYARMLLQAIRRNWFPGLLGRLLLRVAPDRFASADRS